MSKLQEMKIKGEFHDDYVVKNPYLQTTPFNRFFIAHMNYNNPHTTTGFVMLGIGIFFISFGAFMTIARKKWCNEKE